MDNWLGKPLINVVQHPHLVDINLLVANCIDHDIWNLLNFIYVLVPNIQEKVLQITLPLELREDCRILSHSTNGDLSLRDAYFHKLHSKPRLNWTTHIWNKDIHHSRAFMIWKVCHNRLPLTTIFLKKVVSVFLVVDSVIPRKSLLLVYFSYVLMPNTFGIGF